MKKTPTLRFMLAHPAHLVALGFGTGLSPIAPGTVGTLLALPLDALRATVNDVGYALAVTIAFAVGVWAADRTGRDRACPITARSSGTKSSPSGRSLFCRRRAGASGLRVPAVPAVRHRKAAACGIDRPRMASRVGVMADDLVAAGYTLLVLALWQRIAG
jgi:phosphatidylglycerophosphatase A